MHDREDMRCRSSIGPLSHPCCLRAQKAFGRVDRGKGERERGRQNCAFSLDGPKRTLQFRRRRVNCTARQDPSRPQQSLELPMEPYTCDVRKLFRFLDPLVRICQLIYTIKFRQPQLLHLLFCNPLPLATSNIISVCSPWEKILLRVIISLMPTSLILTTPRPRPLMRFRSGTIYYFQSAFLCCCGLPRPCCHMELFFHDYCNANALLAAASF